MPAVWKKVRGHYRGILRPPFLPPPATVKILYAHANDTSFADSDISSALATLSINRVLAPINLPNRQAK